MRYSVKHARKSGLICAIAVIILDQWSKQFFLGIAQSAAFPLEVMPFLNLDIVKNRGISFGMFSGASSWLPLFITLCTSFIVLLLVFWLARARERFVILGLSAIIGGALGNIIDRVHYGFVVDFLDFHLGSYHWPAFNIADTAVFIGVVLLVLMSIVRPNTDL
jgi:signal peptidase II